MSRPALRLSIVHRTDYRYASYATSSYNEIRMTPANSDGQRLLSSSISISPNALLFGFDDYFGTQCYCFDIQHPHNSLAIAANSIVEVSRAGYVGKRISREELSHAQVRERYYEFLAETPLASVSGAVRDAAQEITYQLEPEDAIGAVAEWIQSRLTFGKGLTHARTPAMDALAVGVGVCQDFSHLGISMLRSVGIPARYVSGYLFPVMEPERGLSTEGESHAWVEAWIGGWRAFDSANGMDHIDNRYVKVGIGRDYFDVAPMNGVYTGQGTDPPQVSVTMSVL